MLKSGRAIWWWRRGGSGPALYMVLLQFSLQRELPKQSHSGSIRAVAVSVLHKITHGSPAPDRNPRKHSAVPEHNSSLE